MPVRNIGDVLGLPHEVFAQVKAWSDALSWIVEPVAGREQREAASRAAKDRGEGRKGVSNALFP